MSQDDDSTNTECRDKLIDFLTSANVDFKNWSHKKVFTSQEAAEVRDASLASGAKAMLIKVSAPKSRSTEFHLAVLSAAEQLDSKLFKQVLQVKNIRFASKEEVWDITKCLSGGVPPFGSLFGLQTWCDQSLISQGDIINFNCGLRNQSVQMTLQSYLDVEKPHISSFIV